MIHRIVTRNSWDMGNIQLGFVDLIHDTVREEFCNREFFMSSNGFPIDKTCPSARDKTLFTPGPLTTSLSVKKAMLHDAGSWHFKFNRMVADLRNQVLELGSVSKEEGFECVLMQGSGTFGVEAVFATGTEPGKKVLIIANGAYGERMIQMTKALKIETVILRYGENEIPCVSDISVALEKDPEIALVAVVHCETTTGILNPIEEMGKTVSKAGRRYFVDAMSSFGAIPIDLKGSHIDYLVSSPNKCIEGVPGFSFVITKRKVLEQTEGWARSLSLDLHGQWLNFEKKGQFRYTPPTHSLLAFKQALIELDDEGGIPCRAERYARNHRVLVEGMQKLGFRPYLNPGLQSYIITSFHYPQHAKFNFETFYRYLSDRDMIIYPGKLTATECFRIGSIGRIFESDILTLLSIISAALKQLGMEPNTF